MEKTINAPNLLNKPQNMEEDTANELLEKYAFLERLDYYYES